MTDKIDVSDIRLLIREEIAGTKAKLNHEEAAQVVATASKLLKALEQFEEKAPNAAKDAMMNRAPEVKATLEDMVTNPGAYVSKVKPENVKAADEGPKVMDNGPKVTIKPQGKPAVLDHKAFKESINRRLRAKKRT